jgi:hypothetical protein
MAKTPRATDSGLPRREPGQALTETTEGLEGIDHNHEGLSGAHKHRLGLIPHDHDEDGRPVFHADAKFQAAAADRTEEFAATVPLDGGETDDPAPTPPPGTELQEALSPDQHALADGDEADGPGRPTQLVRADAGETMLSGFMGIINPADDPGFAIRLAEEGMRLGLMAQTLGAMARDNADKRLVSDDLIRAMHLKVRQMAATHGLDLSEVGS